MPEITHILLREPVDQVFYTLVWGEQGTYYMVDDIS